MAHIFISYSHTDTDYAHALADNLQHVGFDVWIDARLDYGSTWPQEIQKQLDTCGAFILIMSPRSFESAWVQNELQRAKRKLKPIFPLLLEGDEPWLSVESTQYYDVRGRNLPDARFYSAIKRVMTISTTASTLNFPKKPGRVKAKASQSAVIIRIIMVAIIGVVAIIFAGIFGPPLIEKWFEPAPVITAISTFTIFPSPVLPGKSSTTTITPDAIISAIIIATEIPVSVITSTPTQISTPTATILPAEITDSKGVQMMLIPAGEFTMGSNTGDGDEKPVHKVYLDAYYMDKLEVTNVFYSACVSADACKPPTHKDAFTRSSYYGNPQYDDYPVVYVNWDMAKTYCEWRSARLPTEAEWEKAARGTDAPTYPWGQAVECQKANYQACIDGTSPAGYFEDGKSPYGVYDMAGNVWEWVADWYSENYYGISLRSNPLGPDSGQARVMRGGSWTRSEYDIRTSNRIRYASTYDNFDVGFRCAMDVTP
jgi:formylglycine-generating enzyme required for sulfatase activity